MLPRQPALNIQGLITLPNQYGVYGPGACKVCDNLLFRAPGEGVTARNLSNTSTVGSANASIQNLFCLDSGTVFNAVQSSTNTWTCNFGTSSATLPSLVAAPTGVTDTVNLFSNLGYINPLRMRDHFFVNTLVRGVIVSDVMAPVSGADRTFRQAGMQQPVLAFYNESSTNAGAIPNQVAVGYAAVFKRVLTNGYEVVSVPSPIYRYVNGAGATRDIGLTIRWNSNDDIVAGDYLELYRTDGISGATTYGTDPGTTLRLVTSKVLSSSEAGSLQATIWDRQPCESPNYTTTGRELYTNPGQEGSTGSYRQPLTPKVMAQYAGYAFYGNLTERPIWNLNVPTGLSSTLATGANTAFFRANGIGRRHGTGTITLGSAVITGVSATEILGIVPGQRWSGPTGTFLSTVTVNSVGATTITMSANALANDTTFYLSDVVEIGINGTATKMTIQDAADFVVNLNQLKQFEVTVNQTIPITTTQYYMRGYTVSIEPIRPALAQSFTVRATNGANYSPAVPEITATAQTFSSTAKKNLLQWSLDNQPEHCPSKNTTNVGVGQLIQMVASRDALWIFCTDGLWRLSGAGGVWDIHLVDPTLILSAPDCAAVLRDVVYAYTNRGLVEISDAGISPITQDTLNDVLPGPSFYETTKYQVVADETNDEILLMVCGQNLGTTATLYCYATLFKKWSTVTFLVTTLNTMAFMRQPFSTSAPGFPIMAASPQSGLFPSYYLWDSASGQPLTSTVLLQPFYGDDPWTSKQWPDCQWIFETADAGVTAQSCFNDTTPVGSGTIKTHATDARITFGVPRGKARRTNCAPGIIIASPAAPVTFKGCSIRYRAVTTQPETR